MKKESNQNDYIINEIRKILMCDWDPIGVEDIPEAYDEYDSYILEVYHLLKEKVSEEDIFLYLWWAETKHMELSGNIEHTKAVAHKLYNLTNKID